MGIAKTDNRIDSLTHVKVEKLPDTAQVDLYNAISKSYTRKNSDSTKHYAQKAIVLGQTINYKPGLGFAYRNMGNYKVNTGDFISGLDAYNKSEDIYKELGDSFNLSGIYNNKAIAYRKMGDYSKAIDYLFKCLAISEQLGIKKIISLVNNNIGNIYFDQESYPKALEHYFKTLEIKINLNDSIGIARTYHNIAVTYTDMADKFKQSNKDSFNIKINKALAYHEKALAINIKLKFKHGIGNSYNALATIHRAKGDYVAAADYAKNALAIRKENNDQYGILNSSLTLGQIYQSLEQYQLSLKYLNEALNMATALNSKNSLVDIYLELSGTYKMMGKFEKSLDSYLKYYSIKEEINKAHVLESEAKYNRGLKIMEKEKEVELAQHDLQLEEEKNMRLLIVIFAVILLMGFIIYEYIQKRKANNLIAMQKKVVEQKNKEIGESINYAMKIQEAILPEVENIKSVLNAFVLYQPKDIVSGDFYWFTQKGDEVIIAAVDCTGHGVPGAFMSLIGSVALRKVVNEMKNWDMGKLLDRLNKEIINDLKQDSKDSESRDGMDLAVCKVNLKNYSLEYAGAYRPLYYYHKNEFKEVRANKMPIGGNQFESEAFTTHEINLTKGDRIYIFSDGYADQFGGIKEKKFTVKRMKELLDNIQSHPLNKHEEFLATAFGDWKGDLEQTDDVLVIGVEV